MKPAARLQAEASGLLTAVTRAGLAGLLAFIVTGCAGAPASPQLAASAPCNAVLMTASNYADDLADAREEQMKLIRFGSEAAMNNYVSQTRHLRMEALRLDEIRVELARKAGIAPEYFYTTVSNPTSEGANAAIAEADACAAAAK